jgi:hypothetical protein
MKKTFFFAVVVFLSFCEFAAQDATGEPPVLTVSKTGSGIIISNPDGINCGSDCNEAYEEGTKVTLTAIADDGWVITDWDFENCDSIECQLCVLNVLRGNNISVSCPITIDRPINAHITFVRGGLINVATIGSGTVVSSPGGINCGCDCSKVFFGDSQIVTLTANPAIGATFIGWEGDCSGTGPCVLDTSRHRNVTANFTQGGQFVLSVSKTGSGTIISSPSGINCGSDCSESYEDGTKVILTIEGDNGWGITFADFSGSCNEIIKQILQLALLRSPIPVIPVYSLPLDIVEPETIAIKFSPVIEPEPPANLTQLKSDETTAISIGGTTNDPTVVFGANVSESENGPLKLQIELRRLDEYGGQFLNTFTQESEFVSAPVYPCSSQGPEQILIQESDSFQVTIPVYGLINGDYHWQARTVDEDDLASDWVQFGENDVSQADFSIEIHQSILQYAIIVAGKPRWTKIDGLIIDHVANNSYKALIKAGFDDEHIYYLNSNQPQDIDHDDLDEVDCPASLNNFEGTIDEIKNKIGNNPSTLIISLSGHGIDNPESFVFDEDNEEYLWVDSFREILDTLPISCRTFIVIGSCYSGVFITAEDEDPSTISEIGRVIITAAHNDQGRLVAGIGWALSSDALWDDLSDGWSVREAFIRRTLPRDITYLWLDDNGDKIGHSPDNIDDDGIFANSFFIGSPVIESIKLNPWIYAMKHSPGELRVYDSQNRITGLVNGEVKEDIPNTAYDVNNDAVVIFNPYDSYNYNVIGDGDGLYGLELGFVEGKKIIDFNSTDLPLSLNAVHRYSIDWQALSAGQEGVTLDVDNDGDGIFETTIIADNNLTQDEFDLQTETTVDINPNVINLRSKGGCVTVYIELPEGFNVEDINISTLTLAEDIPAEKWPVKIGDYDKDGVKDLMAKFDRRLLIDLLSDIDNNQDVELSVSGYLRDGTRFTGSDIIKVINPGRWWNWGCPNGHKWEYRGGIWRRQHRSCWDLHH